MATRTTLFGVVAMAIVVTGLLVIYSGFDRQFKLYWRLPNTFHRIFGQVINASTDSSTLSENQDPAVCDNVLEKMAEGHWVPRNFTLQEKLDVMMFHKKFRESVKLPLGLQRPDKRCGDVIFPGRIPWWRALCDKDGTTPCCFNNVCVNRSIESCTCANCLDLRQVVHAELATWKPVDPACHPKRLSVQEICQVLDGATIYFIGDSMARHAYTAFLLLVRENELTGAMLNRTPPDVRSQCTGMYMFTEKVCRHWLDRKVTICNGTVSLQFLGYYKSTAAKSIHKAVLGLRYQKSTRKTLVFIGIGLHDGLQHKSVQQKVWMPLLQNRTKEDLARPRIVWMGVTSPGLLKPSNTPQSRDNVLRFNNEMSRFLKEWDVPVLDRFNMTDGVMSFDGTHFGLGLNRQTAVMLLNYLQELHLKESW